jgi:phosphatidate cytidylyltransferase
MQAEGVASAAGKPRPMSGLASRVAVSVVGLPLVLGFVYLGGWWLFTLVAVTAAIALHEYSVLVRSLRPLVLAAYVGVFLALLGAELGGPDWALAGFLTTIGLAFVLHWIGDTRQSATVSIASTTLGAAWIGLGLSYVILLRAIPGNGRLAVFTVLLAVFAGDIAAFFAGHLIGRHRMAPAVSPGKTWEGFLFGSAATIFVAFVALYKAPSSHHPFVAVGNSIALGALLAVVGPLGDLFESGLKRDMQVKDSGRLLRGHGGILDRLDAPLFAAVAAFYFLRGIGAA